MGIIQPFDIKDNEFFLLEIVKMENKTVSLPQSRTLTFMQDKLSNTLQLQSEAEQQKSAMFERVRLAMMNGADEEAYVSLHKEYSEALSTVHKLQYDCARLNEDIQKNAVYWHETERKQKERDDEWKREQMLDEQEEAFSNELAQSLEEEIKMVRAQWEKKEWKGTDDAWVWNGRSFDDERSPAIPPPRYPVRLLKESWRHDFLAKVWWVVDLRGNVSKMAF